MGDKISVIVPIYKVEDYLHRCIDSIINQTYTNLEIILVDDGSPDNCPMICDEYAKKDSRIKVIHKKNEGVAVARNVGIDIAAGKYIMFIDSDDFIEKDMIKSMLTDLINNKVDIAVCNTKYIYSNLEKIKDNRENMILNNYEAMQEYVNNGVLRGVVWGQLYKKDLINDIRFIAGKYHEDEFFAYKVVAKAKKIYYNSIPFYNYVQRSNSAMAEYSLNRLDGVEATYERLNFIKERYPSLYINEKKAFLNLCIYSYQMILKNISIDPDKKGRRILTNYIKQLNFTKVEIRNYSFKDKFKIFMSYISLNYCCRVLMIFSNPE